jgi:cell division protein FtsI/penicillin-binding protein 2
MTRRLFLGSTLVFAGPHASAIQWIASHVNNRQQQASWIAPDMPVSMGSLLKPFLLLSYAATHAKFPRFHCLGSRSGCWHSSGHGEQDEAAALANSCNAYFLHLASAIEPAALDSTCLSYGLATMTAFDPALLIGLGAGWPQTPVAVVHAYAALGGNARQSRLAPIFSGMLRCATVGTARDVGFACYAKTGTAPCSHSPRGSGDGFAVALYPVDQPRRALLVQHHNTTGAITARDLKSIARTSAYSA